MYTMLPAVSIDLQNAASSPTQKRGKHIFNFSFRKLLLQNWFFPKTQVMSQLSSLFLKRVIAPYPIPIKV